MNDVTTGGLVCLACYGSTVEDVILRLGCLPTHNNLECGSTAQCAMPTGVTSLVISLSGCSGPLHTVHEWEAGNLAVNSTSFSSALDYLT